MKVVWILTAVNIVTFVYWDVKYRALYKSYLTMVGILYTLLKLESDSVDNVKKSVENIKDIMGKLGEKNE